MFKHKSYVYPQFKYEAILFNPSIGPYRVLLLLARVNLEAMAMKMYSKFPKAPELQELHVQIVQCDISDTLYWGVLPLCWDAVGVFYSSSRLGWKGLGSYLRNSLREYYFSAERHLVYSTTPVLVVLWLSS